MWLDEGGGGFTPISTNPPLYQEEVVSIKTTHCHKHILQLLNFIKCDKIFRNEHFPAY